MRNRILALMLAGLMAFSSVVPTQAAEVSTSGVSTALEVNTASDASEVSEVSSVEEIDESDGKSNSEISETPNTEVSVTSETSTVTESEETDISNDADSEENSVIEQEDTALSDEADLEAASESSLSNPRIVADSSMEAGQKVTWDCVWFGSYPQTEIVANASDCGTYGKNWSKTTDYEVNSSLYSQLSGASGWNSNGDITLNGIKYRRVQKSDATYSTSSSSGYYDWSNSSATYHYFRYEPIKWRVLKVDGSQALLLADEGLDDQRYNTSNTTITWEKSTIRSWLNGYGSSSNTYGTDYSSKNFMDTAFTSGEQNAVLSTVLDNSTTGENSSTYGGNNTNDKVFLLSSYDLYNTDNAAAYGFYKSSYSTYDEARRSQSSTYAKTMGTSSTTSSSYLGNCNWWLRSPGNDGNSAASVKDNGYVSYYGWGVYYYDFSVRPALNINLSSSNLYSYAGTVCSDGTVNEEEVGHVYVERASECKTSTCSKAGVKVSYCRWCGDKQEESLPIKAHTIVADKAVAATVFKTGKTAGKHCSVCKKVITAQKTIAKLKPTIKLSKTSVTVKKKKTVAIKVSKLAKGDSVKSWKTSNKKIATVTSKGVIKGVKKGKATVTVTLKSGKKATVKVKVK